MANAHLCVRLTDSDEPVRRWEAHLTAQKNPSNSSLVNCTNAKNTRPQIRLLVTISRAPYQDSQQACCHSGMSLPPECAPFAQVVPQKASVGPKASIQIGILLGPTGGKMYLCICCATIAWRLQGLRESYENHSRIIQELTMPSRNYPQHQL